MHVLMLLQIRQKVEEVDNYYTRCRSAFRSDTGCLRICLLRFGLPFAAYIPNTSSVPPALLMLM